MLDHSLLQDWLSSSQAPALVELQKGQVFRTYVVKEKNTQIKEDYLLNWTKLSLSQNVCFEEKTFHYESFASSRLGKGVGC